MPAIICVALLLVLPLLAACTDEIDQRAVQPGAVVDRQTSLGGQSMDYVTPSSLGSETGTPTATTSILPISASPVSEASPSRAYFTQGGDLWQLPFASGDASAVVSGKSILAFAPSPDGEQVAVVYLDPSNSQEHLSDFKPDGKSVIDVTLKMPSDDQTSRGGDIQSIAWAPSGDRVVVARQDGSISVVNNDGTVNTIVAADPNRFPGSLQVSPDGQMLLFLDPDLPGRATSLYAVPMTGGGARKLVDGTASSQPVLEAHWVPGGRQIAYAQAVGPSLPETGDVFAIDAVTTASKLVVPSSQFAPVAGVAGFAFSNDGRWLAFTLYVPNGSNSRFKALWLMNVVTGDTEQVPLGADETVTDLWWGKGMLVFRAIAWGQSSRPVQYTGVEPFSLYSVTPDDVTPTLRHKSP